MIFDNFFTSHKLLVRLSSLGYFASGTVRDSRTSRASLCDVKAMKKTDRGSYDIIFDNSNNTIAVRWHDKAEIISEIYFIIYIGRPF